LSVRHQDVWLAWSDHEGSDMINLASAALPHGVHAMCVLLEIE